MFLLRRIRDEVHRYSISFHKNKRNREFIKSQLDEIKGLGKKRIQKIWENYNNFDELKKESINVIHQKTGIPINIDAEASTIEFFTFGPNTSLIFISPLNE